jgi:integrase
MNQVNPSRTSIGKEVQVKDELVKLWKRPSYDGKKFRFYLLYTDLDGKRRQESLGHADSRKAERQRVAKERDLRMNFVEKESMRLSELLEDSIRRSGKQIRPGTVDLHRDAMKSLIKVAGDMDYQAVTHTHAERFVQASLDAGNSPATVARKLRHLKRLFQLAVDRGQLDVNPFKRIRNPRVQKRKIRIYNAQELQAMLRVVEDGTIGAPMNWKLVIACALTTGLRRGELLNLTWQDIDFDRKIVDVQAKKRTPYTWEWHVKDADRRTLPLPDVLVQLLAKHQTEQPDGYPYVFIPPARYDTIQKLVNADKWSVKKGCQPLNNFTRQFELILKRAGIVNGEFHDLRRTCITEWFRNGLTEYDVMTLAGHSSFETTRKFYLAIDGDGLLDRARLASAESLKSKSVANLLQMPNLPENEKGPTSVSACQPDTCINGQGRS